MSEQQPTTPPLAVRVPRRVPGEVAEGDAVEPERDVAHLESVLASLRPPV